MLTLLRRVKRLILKSHLPPSGMLEFFNGLLSLGQWLRKHPAGAHLDTREELYNHVIGSLKDTPFDYLEFGVFKGDSIRHWAKTCASKGASFYGFDTFTGLPEKWQTAYKTFDEHHFDTGGATPQIEDARVQFVKGLFQDTLPPFLAKFSRKQGLVIHCDADLYSSTLFVLTKLDAVINAGTIILFDNFSVANHDFRALIDWAAAYRRTYEVIATAEVDYEKVAVRIL